MLKKAVHIFLSKTGALDIKTGVTIDMFLCVFLDFEACCFVWRSVSQEFVQDANSFFVAVYLKLTNIQIATLKYNTTTFKIMHLYHVLLH